MFKQVLKQKCDTYCNLINTCEQNISSRSSRMLQCSVGHTWHLLNWSETIHCETDCGRLAHIVTGRWFWCLWMVLMVLLFVESCHQKPCTLFVHVPMFQSFFVCSPTNHHFCLVDDWHKWHETLSSSFSFSCEWLTDVSCDWAVCCTATAWPCFLPTKKQCHRQSTCKNQLCFTNQIIGWVNVSIFDWDAKVSSKTFSFSQSRQPNPFSVAALSNPKIALKPFAKVFGSDWIAVSITCCLCKKQLFAKFQCWISLFHVWFFNVLAFGNAFLESALKLIVKHPFLSKTLICCSLCWEFAIIVKWMPFLILSKNVCLAFSGTICSTHHWKCTSLPAIHSLCGHMNVTKVTMTNVCIAQQQAHWCENQKVLRNLWNFCPRFVTDSPGRHNLHRFLHKKQQHIPQHTHQRMAYGASWDSAGPNWPQCVTRVRVWKSRVIRRVKDVTR